MISIRGRIELLQNRCIDFEATTSCNYFSGPSLLALKRSHAFIHIPVQGTHKAACLLSLELTERTEFKNILFYDAIL